MAEIDGTTQQDSLERLVGRINDVAGLLAGTEATLRVFADTDGSSVDGPMSDALRLLATAVCGMNTELGLVAESLNRIANEGGAA